jgi:hypothetical protein
MEQGGSRVGAGVIPDLLGKLAEIVGYLLDVRQRVLRRHASSVPCALQPCACARLNRKMKGLASVWRAIVYGGHRC